MVEGQGSYDGHVYSYRYYKGPTSSGHAPILFLNGAFQSMDSFQRFVRDFVSESDVLVIDLPGTGRSDPLPASFGLTWLADALNDFMTEQEIAPAFVVASSYSSALAYKFAQLYSEKISALALYGLMASFPTHMRTLLLDSIEYAKRGDTQSLAEVCVSGMLNSNEAVYRSRATRRVLSKQINSMSARELAQYVTNSNRLLEEDPLDLTKPPQIKTLLFTGEFDNFTMPEEVHKIASAIPQSLFCLVRHADHIGHLERPDVISAILKRFRDGLLDDEPSDDWTEVTRF